MAECILVIQQTIKMNKRLKEMRMEIEKNKIKWLALMATEILEIQKRTINRRIH